MKKDNALKRAARWVARMFGYKAENKFARGLWYVFATCASIVVLFLAISLIINAVDEIKDLCSAAKDKRQQNDPTYLHEYSNEHISCNVIYHNSYPAYLYNTVEGRKTITDIQWISRSSDGDSLAVCCVGDKRGYFNRFTGKMVIPPQYDAAWVFSEGMACVMKGWRMTVIDHQGKPLFEQSFPYDGDADGFCFHNGLCPMGNGEGKSGLINKKGEWVVAPVYNDVEHKSHDLWWVRDSEGNEGLLDRDGKVLLPTEFSNLKFSDDNKYIFALNLNHRDQVYDIEGNLVNSCSFEETELMEYEGDEYEYSDVYETRVRKSVAAGLMRYYTSDNHYGLIDREGNIITPPLYTYIKAIGPDRYQCDSPQGAVILDGKGRECGTKL